MSRRPTSLSGGRGASASFWTPDSKEDRVSLEIDPSADLDALEEEYARQSARSQEVVRERNIQQPSTEPVPGGVPVTRIARICFSIGCLSGTGRSHPQRRETALGTIRSDSTPRPDEPRIARAGFTTSIRNLLCGENKTMSLEGEIVRNGSADINSSTVVPSSRLLRVSLFQNRNLSQRALKIPGSFALGSSKTFD